MDAPKLPKIFKHHQARGFDYQPMYYDSVKEERQKLIDRYEGKTVERTKDSFKTSLQSDWSRNRGTQVTSSRGRLFVIMTILFGIAYFIITY